MKKRLKNLFYPTLVVLVFMVALNVKININKKQFTSINLLNIETLTYAESLDESCYGSGSVDCASNKNKVKYVY